eukprot:Hpha_TRINITY_DN15187_c4_g3::TRINITY_DN15187_c4_g3_i1::g.129433::m.129433
MCKGAVGLQLLLLALAVGATESEEEPKAWIQLKPGERKTLSEHRAICVFEGLKKMPRQDGSVRKIAWFKIESYEHFKLLHEEYGDKRQERFAAAAEDAHDDPQELWFHQKVHRLRPGTRVRLEWMHEYVSIGGGAAPELYQPERQVRGLEEVGEEL